MRQTKETKKNSGITLISLIVTIIILLILAGISISMLTGNNGIIKNARSGKTQTEIAEEREAVELSATQASGKNKYGDITADDVQSKLNDNLGEGEAEAIDNGDTVIVKFLKSNRYYEIDGNGNAIIKEIAEDKYAGDITKGGTLDGNTEETAYQINCIEDLVAFSIMSNGGNIDLNLSSSDFKGKYIKLMRDLDFNSIFSYDDYTTKEYGDLNADGTTEDIRTELIKTDSSCIGFTPIGSSSISFKGTFDGNNHKMENIYENASEYASLFGYGQDAYIKNLTLSGILKSGKYAAGICVTGSGKITNCNNYATIIGTENAGGMMSRVWGGSVEIINCKNFGKINGKIASGILGYEYSGSIYVLNCVNAEQVNSDSGTAGGIIGGTCAGSIKIYNSYNTGTIIGQNIVGGILGSKYHTTRTEIKNCYNIGEIQRGDKYKGEVIGFNWAFDEASTPSIENSYYMKSENKALDSGASNFIGNIYCLEDYTIDEIINSLNEYKETAKVSDAICTNWKEWIKGKKGYPELDL